MKYFIATLLLVFVLPFLAKAQDVDTSASEKIKIVYADLQRTIKTSSGFDRYLEGRVQIIKDSSYFYCDTARINDDFLNAWGDVSMLKNDSLEVFADSMVYDLETEEADIYGSVYVQSKDEILFSDYIHYNDRTDIAYYTDKAILRSKEVELKSKRGEFRTTEDLAIFSKKVSVVDSAFQLFADTLLYRTDLNKAIFKGPTNIVLDSADVYCEAGYFLLDEDYGVFKQNARYVGEKDTAIADTIKADGVGKIVELIGNAYYQGETAYAEGDYIKYNQRNGDVEVRGNAFVLDGEQRLRSDVIFYNKKTKLFSSEGRSTINSASNQLQADNIESLDKTGRATGDVIFQDTSGGVRIDSDILEFDQAQSSYNKAYNLEGPALLRAKMDGGDSLYIVADTLYSFQDITFDTLSSYDQDSVLSYTYLSDTIDYLTAYYKVSVYNTDFQAVCDSLAYNTKDSILTLYKDPIMWSDTSQFKGDTIVMYFNGESLDRLDLFPKSFIINSTDEVFYNQIRGKRTNAFFTEGKIDSMIVSGNAQSIYYLQDDNKGYIGVNKTDCTAMVFLFDEQLDHIKFLTEPVAHLYPMEKINHDEIKLEGFSWDAELRPNDKSELHSKLRTLSEIEEKPSEVPQEEGENLPSSGIIDEK